MTTGDEREAATPEATAPSLVDETVLGLADPTPSADELHPGGWAARLRRVGAGVVACALAGALLLTGGSGRGWVTDDPAVGARAASSGATILVGEPQTIDPAAEGDSSSAAVTAQLFETLTAYDPDLRLRPALAENWEILDGGLRVRFHLRKGLTFSDGSPIRGADVVRSWLRILDPASPSPLAGLATDIAGAEAYLGGTNRDPSSVGISASGDDVEVRLVRPADLPSIVSSPTFAVVPPAIDRISLDDPSGFVGSGAYRLVAVDTSSLHLVANDRYWAGPPSIGSIRLAFDIGGRSPVEAFTAGEVDYTPIAPSDASWIGWDADLGPRLVATPSLTVDYYGFDTSRPPFDDVRVRRAFAMAVDWQRIATLSSRGEAIPATSMVPEGMPGRSGAAGAVVYDPAAARALLAEAGYAGGAGLPTVALVTGGSPYDDAVAAELRTVLGVKVAVEHLSGDSYLGRLSADPPAMWALGWVADYPSPNDFLGVLLGGSSPSNYSRWRSSAFDTAIAEAVSAADPATAAAAYGRAEGIVAREVPVVPVAYSTGYALVRNGLLGAGQNGMGILRLAGLAWK